MLQRSLKKVREEKRARMFQGKKSENKRKVNVTKGKESERKEKRARMFPGKKVNENKKDKYKITQKM
jgi:hypothetical protein